MTCEHRKNIETVAVSLHSGTVNWCGDCGAINRNGEWRTPLLFEPLSHAVAHARLVYARHAWLESPTPSKPWKDLGAALDEVPDE